MTRQNLETIESARARLTSARQAPRGETLEQQQAHEQWIRHSLLQLDSAIWRNRHAGETVAEARARLAPDVDW